MKENYSMEQRKINNQAVDYAQLIINNLKIYRKFCNLTMEQVYEMCDINASQIWCYEHGRGMNMLTYCKLVAFYDLFIKEYRKGYPKGIVRI